MNPNYKIEYKICLAEDHNMLANKVNKMIANNWEPQGGISVSVNPARPAFSTTRLYCQAMVKVSRKEEEE